jgi:hypothetical protein
MTIGANDNGVAAALALRTQALSPRQRLPPRLVGGRLADLSDLPPNPKRDKELTWLPTMPSTACC